MIDFTGVLQTAATVNGTWGDVPNSPTSPFAVPPGSTQFFRARAQ